MRFNWPAFWWSIVSFMSIVDFGFMQCNTWKLSSVTMPGTADVKKFQTFSMTGAGHYCSPLTWESNNTSSWKRAVTMVQTTGWLWQCMKRLGAVTGSCVGGELNTACAMWLLHRLPLHQPPRLTSKLRESTPRSLWTKLAKASSSMISKILGWTSHNRLVLLVIGFRISYKSLSKVGHA